ncbi:AAA family ATPase [Geminicoccaceae bacterium 1502E]|nr:AAA family ATPase [Geminicoccaceae bacterium 1502E]
MRLRSIRLQNFKCVEDDELPVSDPTILIGPNGSGKSTFLMALRAFFGNSSILPQDSYFGRDHSRQIRIALSFSELTQDEREFFSDYVRDDMLSITRVFINPSSGASGRFYGQRRANVDFMLVRSAKSAADKKIAYEELAKKYTDLPQWRSQQAALDALYAWEQSHPSECSWIEDDGQFFGFSGVGKGNLSKFVNFLYIPAVHDASDEAEEGKNTAITKLVDIFARSVLDNDPHILELKRTFLENYRKAVDPSRLDGIATLSQDLTKRLLNFYPGIDVDVQWQDIENAPTPDLKADVLLKEQKFSMRVGAAGHGLQRAFIISILQHLTSSMYNFKSRSMNVLSAKNHPAPERDTKCFNVIIGIEEPELYQHMTIQRHFSRVLFDLAKKNLSQATVSYQVILTTHSPAFVDVKQFSHIRRVRKRYTVPAGIPYASVVVPDEEDIATALSKATHIYGDVNSKNSFSTLVPKLHIVDADLSEGFFSEAVILVEGAEDKAILEAAAETLEENLSARDICILPANGKNNLDKLLVIFRGLNIFTYVVWDGDANLASKNNAQTDNARKWNKGLLQLNNAREEDWPNRVESTFAVFEETFSRTVEKEIGATLYRELIEKIKRSYGYQKDREVTKNPLLLAELLQEAATKGKRSLSAEKIVKLVVETAMTRRVAREGPR